LVLVPVSISNTHPVASLTLSGRRICVGYSVGDDNLFIAIARLVYCFDVFEDPDEPIDLSLPLLGSTDEPAFKAIVKPRSSQHESLIRRECRGTEGEVLP